MFNQNIISNKFDLNWSTTFSYTTFVRFSDYYINISREDNSFRISLYWESYALNYLPLVYPSVIDAIPFLAWSGLYY